MNHVLRILVAGLFVWIVTGTTQPIAYGDVSVNYVVPPTDRDWREPSPVWDLRIFGRMPRDGMSILSAAYQWVAQDSGTSLHFYGIGSSSSQYILSGAAGMLRVSSNGWDWVDVAHEASGLLMNVNGDGPLSVVVGEHGAILTSADGANWTLRSTPTTQLLRGIAYGSGRYVACGGEGVILYSLDGELWSATESGTTETLQGVAYGDGQFIVVGASGVLLASVDGVTWTPRTSGTGSWLLDVTYGNGRFVAVGLLGVMRVSEDGLAWSGVSSATTRHLYRVVYADGRFIAVGADGAIVSSSSGLAWNGEASGISTDLRGVIALDGVFVGVGFEGRILIRQPIDDVTLPGDGSASASQPEGALTDVLVFTSAGHGFTYINANNHWRTQRPLLYAMVEDMGNLDQMNPFADYVFRAGGTVVPFRPLGYQTNEVVLDNVSAGVSFGGLWHDSSSSVYYGQAGEVPYRYAYISTTGTTAWAVYRPNLPEAGFYPVYAWSRHGSDRVRQLYRIEHSGGMTDVRVNHRRVGNGWVWLGTYYFAAGTSGSVQISNYAPGEHPAVNVVVADAIRFGNGMGDVARGSAGVSGFERELEASRYWIQRMVGQGMPSTLYDNPDFTDWNDNIGAPPRMAAEMNRSLDGSFWDRIYIGFHSNADGGAGTARGPVGLWDNRGTELKQDRQRDLGRLMADEIHADMAWAAANGFFLDTYANNTANLYGAGFGEIFGAMNDHMNSTIIETLFHNNATDANLLRDPVARRIIARSCYQAVVRHLSTNNAAVPQIYLPDPPGGLSVVNTAYGELTLRWLPPGATPISGDPPDGYVIYRSSNGYGFGHPVRVEGASTTQVTLSGMPVGETIYFQVASVNSGGESLPSAVVGARVSPEGRARHLVVNGFERNDRSQSPLRYFGHGLNGHVTLVRQRQINSFDYVVQHGEALAAADHYFDSCDNTALLAGDLVLDDYFAAYWFLGRESTRNHTFNSAEQMLVQEYLQQGGRLFLSGANISYDLDFTGSTADRAFIHTYLTVAYAAADAGQFSATPATDGFLDGVPTFSFDDGSGPTYRVAFADVYHAHNGSVPLLYYGTSASGSQIAGVSYAGGWRSVVLGFPFETILEPGTRHIIMDRVANEFFGDDPIAVGGATTGTPVAVSHHWLRGHFGDDIDYENVAQQWTASGRRVWQAYVAGLDPLDADAELLIIPQRAESHNVIEWLGTDQPGRIYSIHWTTNLHHSMVPLVTGIPSHYPALNVYTDILHSTRPVVFYRLEVELE